MKKQRLLFALLMAIVMMAMSPMNSWAHYVMVTSQGAGPGEYDEHPLVGTDEEASVDITLAVGDQVAFVIQGEHDVECSTASDHSIGIDGLYGNSVNYNKRGSLTVAEAGTYRFTLRDIYYYEEDILDDEGTPTGESHVDANANLTVTPIGFGVTQVTNENYSSLGLANTYVGYYAVSNANGLAWVENKVRTETATYNNIKVVLTADIDLSGIATWTPIGSSTAKFMGIFDGNGHSITGMSILNYTTSYQGLFAWVEGTSGNHAVLKNFSLSGTMTSSTNGPDYIGGVVGRCADFTDLIDVTNNVNITIAAGIQNNHIGGVAGWCQNTTMTRCVNNGNIDAGYSSNCVGGIMGYSTIGSYLTDCINTGDIVSTKDNAYIAGILGYIAKANFGGVFDCLNTGTIIGGNTNEEAGAIYGRYGQTTTNHGGSNNYYLAGSAEKGFGHNLYEDDLTSIITSVTAEQLASGEVCYRLNGDQSNIAWYQTIGTDNTPVLVSNGSNTVYHQNEYQCDGTTVIREYSNSENGSVQEHDFTQQKAEETYLHSPATFTAQARYYYSCSRCNASENDENHTFAHGEMQNHVMTHHEAVAATCTTAGMEEYYTCSHAGCKGKYFKNEGGTEEWGSEPIIPALGHSYTQQKAEEAYLYSPATCTAQARYYYSCSRCNASEHNASHTFAHGAMLSHTPDANNVCTVCGTNVNATSKAVYNDRTLTFYHDESDHLSDGTVYALNTGTNYPGWNSIKSSITSVVFDESFADARPTTCYAWFFVCSKLTEITGIENLNTENVTNMSNLFYGCSGLLSLDLSKFNTEKVTSMERMFNNCSKLQSLDVGKFNTENVTNMSYMFSGCSGLLSLDLSKFNTEKVKNMSGMFHECSGLKSLDLSKFNTEMVTNMSSMFSGCLGLQSLDLSKFNTGMVTNMSSMFYGCSGLLSLDLSKFNTEKVKNMERMFYNCSKLQSLDLSNFNTEKVTNMSTMFQSCSSLESLDLSSFNTTMVIYMTVMFQNCPSLKTLDFGNFDMQKVTSNYNLFFDNSALKTINFKSVPFVNQYFNTQSLSNGVTVNYVLDDNSVIYTGATNYLPAATSASYTRQMSAASQWGTVVLPFDAVSNEDVQLYELTAVTGDQMTFSPVDNVTANTPCVFKKKDADATSVTFTGSNVSSNIPATPSVAAGETGWTAKGTYTALTEQTGMYFVAQNKFWLAEAPITIAPFRAWFEGNIGAGAKALNIVVEEDDADGILNITDQLTGRDGKYLENGHIVIVKNGKKFNLNGQKIK